MAAQVEPRGVDVSLRVYRALLGAYPATFREEFGTEMTLVFRDRCREVIDGQGAPGLIGFWLLALLDLIKTSIEEHTQREGGMVSKSTMVRGAGVFLLITGIMWALGSLADVGPGNAFTYSRFMRLREIGWMALWYSVIPMLLGSVGLYLGYGQDAGVVGQVGIGAAILGAVAAVIAIPLTAMNDALWNVWMFGIFTVVGGLFVFGIMAIIHKPLPRWNAVAALFGPSLLVQLWLDQAIIRPVTEQRVAMGLLVAMGIVWVVLGVGLMVARPARQPVPA